MPVDLRYHIGSLVAIFLALLLGILVGIGLAPNPQELNSIVSQLKGEYLRVGTEKDREIKQLNEVVRESDMLTRETVAALIEGRLSGTRIAIIADHPFGDEELPDTLQAALTQAGATVTSSITITRQFVQLPPELKERLSQRLGLYPAKGVYFRTALAEALADEMIRGGSEFTFSLQAAGIIRVISDTNLTIRPRIVLLVGGAADPADIAPERIDLPLIRRLNEAGIRVVGVEAKTAKSSVIPLYKAAGIPTVDNADTPPGRLATVLLLAGQDGHYGVKDTADSFLPKIAGTGRR